MFSNSSDAHTPDADWDRIKDLLPGRPGQTGWKDRHVAERFWAQVPVDRRGATRYEKTARSFLAMVHVASIMLLLR